MTIAPPVCAAGALAGLDLWDERINPNAMHAYAACGVGGERVVDY
jgi:hypothetical protein